MAIEKKEVKTPYYKLIGEIGENAKCPPQAKHIVSIVKAAGGKITRDELIKLLSRPPAEGGLTTNQKPERVLGFYRPTLKEMGVLLEEIEVSTIEVEVPDKPEKPAPAPKEAKEGKEPKAEKPAAEPAKQETNTKKKEHKAA